MATQDLNALKVFLKDYVDNITTRSKGNLYVCPICGSGTGANKTGAFSIFSNGQRCKCFACGFGDGKGNGADIYDLCAAYEGVDLPEAAKRIISRYGSAATQTGGSYKRSTAADDFKLDAKEPAQPPRDFADEIARYVAALEGSPAQAYLQGRGLTLETMRRFNLGYDAGRRCVTIPYNPRGTYYGRRSIDPNAAKKHDNLAGVPMPIFNPEALYTSDVCFIVESPLCAISITQEGGTAVAISGTGGRTRLCEQLKRKPTAAALVLCLDNDDAGRKATDDIGRALDDFGGLFVVNGTAAIMGEQTNPEAADYRKDPNDVLQHSGAEALREAVKETVEATEQARQAATLEAEAERGTRTGAGMVDAFLQAIQTEKYKPMQTGISDIDRALCGGFTRQQVIMLGAAPGAGKTALAQWIFEGMAQRGTPCVYVNLEMSREQLLARSISRIAARQGVKIRALEILQGYKWTEEQRAAILAAADDYKANIAPRFIMNPDGITADLDTILAYLETEAQRAEKAEQPAPVCVLDYLQLVSGQPREDAATVIKRAVAGLKGYAIKHNTICFIIIAHNRQANSTGAVSMEAARDTSAIEYSADLQLALTFTDCLKRNGKKGKAPEDLTPEEKRKITLRIVKGRFGGSGTDVDLYFDGNTMTYTQTAGALIETNEPTPFDEPDKGKKPVTRTMRF